MKINWDHWLRDWTLISVLQVHLVDSTDQTTPPAPRGSTPWAGRGLPYLALGYGMWVLSQRQRQKVLLPSLETCGKRSEGGVRKRSHSTDASNESRGPWKPWRKEGWSRLVGQQMLQMTLIELNCANSEYVLMSVCVETGNSWSEGNNSPSDTETKPAWQKYQQQYQ